jgi:hypothetical protein
MPAARRAEGCAPTSVLPAGRCRLRRRLSSVWYRRQGVLLAMGGAVGAPAGPAGLARRAPVLSRGHRSGTDAMRTEAGRHPNDVPQHER